MGFMQEIDEEHERQESLEKEKEEKIGENMNMILKEEIDQTVIRTRNIRITNPDYANYSASQLEDLINTELYYTKFVEDEEVLILNDVIFGTIEDSEESEKASDIVDRNVSLE